MPGLQPLLTFPANTPARVQALSLPQSEYFEVYDDFLFLDTAKWESTDDGGTGTNAVQDAKGGIENIVTAAADNDHHTMATYTEAFIFDTTTLISVAARLKISEGAATEAAFIFGLMDTLTTGGLQAHALGPLASYDGAVFWKDEAGTTINFETSNAATQSTTLSCLTFTTDTWYQLGYDYFFNDGVTGKIYPWILDEGNGQTRYFDPQDITISGLLEMHFLRGVKAGPTGAAETLQTDWVHAVQTR